MRRTTFHRRDFLQRAAAAASLTILPAWVPQALAKAPVQFPRPEITVAFDWDQDKARNTRLTIFDRVVQESIPIAAVHLPFPGIGLLRKKGAEYVFDPAPWQLF